MPEEIGHDNGTVRKMKDFFLQLIRLGTGVAEKAVLPDAIDWPALKSLAERQGLLGVALDGIEKLPAERKPAKLEILQWFGPVVQAESQSATQQKASADMAELFHKNAIRTYVLKGAVVAECYPNPAHRNSVDLDCFLLWDKDGSAAWSVGNEIIKAAGFDVRLDYYKNSTFILPGLMVENHRYLVPFRGNAQLTSLEALLQKMMREDRGKERIGGTCLYRPPVMVTALFLIEHAYSHFLHEGLTWRFVLDWMLFSRRHGDQIDWPSLSAFINEFGFRKFYDSFVRLGEFLLGNLEESALTDADKMMLADVWADLDLHESVRGIRGKFALVGNTWRARWKYRLFTEMSWVRALWIQVKGVVLMKHPKLD